MVLAAGIGAMTFGQAAGLAGIGALGGIGGGILSSVSSARSAKRAYKYSLKLQQHQYDLNQRALRESPSASREGYVNAGYNPLLALGSNGMGFNSGASMTPTENNLAGDVSNGVNSAIAMKQADASISNVNANSALQVEQAETERAKRVNLQFQNAMLDVQKHLADKDLSSYDRRFYANLYEQMQRAENYRANSAVAQMNADTNRYNAETNRHRSGWQNYRDYVDSKYGNPIKTSGYSWDKGTNYQGSGMPQFWY